MESLSAYEFGLTHFSVGDSVLPVDAIEFGLDLTSERVLYREVGTWPLLRRRRQLNLNRPRVRL